MIDGYYDELEVGQTSLSRGRTITETDVVGFAGLSGDFHPLHTDDVYAERGPFGGRIAHGLLTLAIASGLMTLSTESIQAFYGLDRVRFLRPVHLGDTVRVRSEIAEMPPPDENGRGVVTLAVTVENQRDEPVLAMQMKFVVSSRAASGTVSAA